MIANTRSSLMFAAAASALFLSSDVMAQSGSRSPSRAPSYQPRQTYQAPPSYRPQGSSTRTLAGSDSRTMSKVIAMQAYSPVAVVTQRQWVKGNSQFQTTFDSKTYYFANAAEKQQFDGAPEKYLPALGGDCVVCLVNGGARVGGSVMHAATSEGRVFLFTSTGEKDQFLANPGAYVNADLAFGGNCAVCYVKGGKTVPGKPEFTAIYNGMRYLFPSAAEKAEFQKQPAAYASRVANAVPAGSGTR